MGAVDESEMGHMSQWTDHNMDQRVRDALGAVHLNNPDGHHLGRPFVTSYQLAIALAEADPELCGVLGKDLGGAGTGANHSLAQYLGRELSRRIGAGTIDWVEGAFLSNERVQEMAYRGPDGEPVVSSVSGSGYDLAVFRLASVLAGGVGA